MGIETKWNRNGVETCGGSAQISSTISSLTPLSLRFDVQYMVNTSTYHSCFERDHLDVLHIGMNAVIHAAKFTHFVDQTVVTL